MKKLTTAAAKKLSDQREDGEEAIKNAAKVMPLDGGRKDKTGSVNPDPPKTGRK
jgi:hypothetical protein